MEDDDSGEGYAPALGTGALAGVESGLKAAGQTMLKDTPAVTRYVLTRIPKAELHCHLDGAVRPSTADEIAIANDSQLILGRPAPLFSTTLSLRYSARSALASASSFKRRSSEPRSVSGSVPSRYWLIENSSCSSVIDIF